MTSAPQSARTYQVRTYGCQMNVHDSGTARGLLEGAGYRQAPEGTDADVVVFNTCAVRENADNKLYGNISHLAPRKQADPDMQIAVGGCLAQKDRDTVLKRAPGSTWCSVPTTSDRCPPSSSVPATTGRLRSRSPRRCGNSRRHCRPLGNPLTRPGFPSRWAATTPARSASFPLRGKEVDRRPADILAEVRSLVDQGVLEVTLLGQNVNAYGVSFADSDIPRDRAPSPHSCARAVISTDWSGSDSPPRTRRSSPMT